MIIIYVNMQNLNHVTATRPCSIYYNQYIETLITYFHDFVINKSSWAFAYIQIDIYIYIYMNTVAQIRTKGICLLMGIIYIIFYLEGQVNLLMSKPTDQLTQILSNSPFAEPNHAIRGEALEFILDFVSRFHIQEHVALFPF